MEKNAWAQISFIPLLSFISMYSLFPFIEIRDIALYFYGMLSELIKKQIELKANMKIRYSSDCDILAEKIFTECRFNISASTLRRLFGFVKGTKTVRIQTLDAISNYLGCSTWDELIQPLNKESKVTTQIITEIKANKIKVGDKYQYTYKPEAEIIVEYIGKSYFKVISAKNSPLKNDDLFKVGTLALHHPLFISEIERNGETIEKVTEAKISGITSIKKI